MSAQAPDGDHGTPAYFSLAADMFEGRDVLHFIDNTSAQAALAKGFSAAIDSAYIGDTPRTYPGRVAPTGEGRSDVSFSRRFLETMKDRLTSIAGSAGGPAHRLEVIGRQLRSDA